MFPAERQAVRRLATAFRVVGAFLLLWLAGFGASAEAQPQRTEVWLVTYGPGEIYWQRFGHNAIWIRDPGLGLDHTFNFGFFDFEQKGFLLNFVQGRLMYFSAAQPAQSEFAQYINENRSIRAQRLGLTPEQALDLADALVREIQPENREYLYDYYVNNCSTRVRDALDAALGGALRGAFATKPARQSWRDHTRRLSSPGYWLYLGLELGLGSNIDRPVSRWDEFFVPGELAEGVAGLTRQPGGQGGPLVTEDVMLYQSTATAPPATVAAWWPRYFWIPVLLLVAAGILVRLVPAMDGTGLARLWLAVAGTAGLLMVCLWLFTDHEAARNNLNLLVFNPVWLVAAISKRWMSPVGWLILAMAGLAILSPLMPPHQYTADVLAAFLPLNFVAGWLMVRAKPRG